MTGTTHPTDATIIRAMQEQIVKAAILEFSQTHPEQKGLPSPVQWAGGILAAIMAFIATGLIGWGAFTLSDLKETVARIDERQKAQVGDFSGQIEAMDRRVSRLEEFHRKDPAK